MLRDGAARGGLATTSCAHAPHTWFAHSRWGQRGGAPRPAGAPAGGAHQRRRRLLVSGSATFAVEVADKLSSGYGATPRARRKRQRPPAHAPLRAVLPASLHPGSVIFNALGAVSLSSLVAGSVSISKSLWESFGRRSVFGDDADEAVQARGRTTRSTTRVARLTRAWPAGGGALRRRHQRLRHPLPPDGARPETRGALRPLTQRAVSPRWCAPRSLLRLPTQAKCGAREKLT